MNKRELIAEAIVGNAIINSSVSVIRYDITPRGSDENGAPFDYPSIVLCIRSSDGAICEDETYFTDGVTEEDLSDADGELLQQAVKQVMIRAR